MHSTYQITGNGIAAALTGIARSVQMPAKKAKDYSRQSRVMARAWADHREWLAEHPNASARYRRIMFAHHLKHAHVFVNAQINPVFITDEQARFIGSDSRWR